MTIFKAAVVGAGTMGGEIAQVISYADIPVLLKDVDQKFVDIGIEKARSIYQGRVDKGKMTPEDFDHKLSLIEGTTDYDDFGDVDFVIEAVPEKMPIKLAVFKELDERTPGHAILASNTSSLSITEFGRATSRPEKVIGFHFFYPASVMKLVEVIDGGDTSEETAQEATAFVQQIRKLPIRCKEVPGFLVNRVLMSALSEIWRYQEETGAEFAEIDKAISEAKAAPLGPFLLTDLVGLDTVLHVAEYLAEAYPERNYVSSKLKDLVDAGNLGQKSGQGFYPHGG